MIIAFWAVGEGEPLAYMPQTPWNHIQLEWDMPLLRAQFDRLTEVTRVVRYDSRGNGLSDRNIREFPLATIAVALVVAALGGASPRIHRLPVETGVR